MIVTRIMFKSEASLWEMVASGQRNWEARVDDRGDPRIKALHDTGRYDLQMGLWNKVTNQVIWVQVNTIYKYPQFGNWLFMEIEPLHEYNMVPGPVAFDPGPITRNVDEH